MKKEIGKKITIDELARMMNRSFEHLEKKMDDKFAKVDERFDQIDWRLDTLEKNTNGHENRISHLEDDMRVVKTAVGK